MARDNRLHLPNVNLNTATRGTPVAVFQRGFDAYEMRGDITLTGADGSTAEGSIVATEVGKLFNLAQRFMGNAIYVAPAAAAVPGYYNPEAALFDALEDENDPKALHPLTPYTVVMVVLRNQPAPMMMPAAPQG
jgi:hypothetical protein